MISKSFIRRVLFVNQNISNTALSRDILESIGSSYGRITFDCANCFGDSCYYLSKYYYDAIIVPKNICGVDSAVYSCICNLCNYPPPIIISDEFFDNESSNNGYNDYIQEDYDEYTLFSKIKNHFETYDNYKHYDNIKLNKQALSIILKNFNININCSILKKCVVEVS